MNIKGSLCKGGHQEVNETDEWLLALITKRTRNILAPRRGKVISLIFSPCFSRSIARRIPIDYYPLSNPAEISYIYPLSPPPHVLFLFPAAMSALE